MIDKKSILHLISVLIPIFFIILYTELSWPYILLGYFITIHNMVNKMELGDLEKRLASDMLKIIFAWLIITLK